jgi:coatomer subunit beta
MDNDKVCTLIINGDKKVQPTPMDLQKKFETASSLYMQKKDPKKLVEALEELLLFMVNGNSYPKLLMTIIRFVITCDDHRIKKILGLYWELCDKVKDNGELKEEMVLVWYVSNYLALFIL